MSKCGTAPVQNRLPTSRVGLLTVLLLSVVLCLQAPLSAAVTPLSDWKAGIATNYGGPKDGKNPYDPSWGTLDVSILHCTLTMSDSFPTV
jgi:hypothetical protein